MTSTTNILQTVQVFNRANLARLQNSYCAIAMFNKKFKNFQNEIANLGSSTTFDLPPRFTVADGLVASFQPAVQIPYTLTCDQAANVSMGFTAQERIFNVDKEVDSYMSEFGDSAVVTLGAKIESNILLNAHSAVPVYTVVNGQQVPTGALHTESGPFKFFGDGATAINSYQQLEQMIQQFRVTGSPDKIWVILPNTYIPAIIGSGLNQFAMNRNNDLANSWEIGGFGTPIVRYYSSNLLPVHVSGNVGNAGGTSNQLTVISTNDPTGQNITQMTLSGATASDANAISQGDVFQFVDGVAGQTNLRCLTFYGGQLTNQRVQNRITNNAAADGSGHVVINLAVPFQSSGAINTYNQGINANIVAGMKIAVMPSHQTGLLVAGDAAYLAMPRLPDQSPFATANEADPKSGAALRFTNGAQFGQNFQGSILDCTWGSGLPPFYCMRMLFPL